MSASLAAIRDIPRSVQAKADELLAVQTGDHQAGHRPPEHEGADRSSVLAIQADPTREAAAVQVQG